MIDRKTGNGWALAVAMVVGVVLILYQQYYYEKQHIKDVMMRENTPAETFFIVRNVAVPNFVEGEDPVVTYDREIKSDFKGDWVAEIHKVSDSNGPPACVGSGTNNYKPGRKLPATGVTLSWYVGKNCALKAGRYIIATEWIMTIPNYPQKVTRFTSNPFAVIPRGGQIYVTPEQVQKLEAE